MKYICSWIFILTALSGQHLLADMHGNCSPCEQDSCCETDCCEPCDFVPPCPPSDCAYNAPFIVDTKCDWGFFAGASFVYAQAIADGLRYADTQIQVKNGLNSEDFNVNYLRDFEYNPGFKVNLGYKLGCDNWIANVEYFRYHNTIAKDSFELSNIECNTFNLDIYNNGTSSIVSNQSGFVESASAKSSYRLNLDQLDFTLSRQYYVGRCLTVKPEAGLRLFWIDQSSTASAVAPNNDGKIDTASINESNSIWSVGPISNLSLDWNIWCNFRIVTSAGFGLLYYEQGANVSVSDLIPADDDLDNRVFDNKGKIKSVTLHNSLMLGLGWSDYFCCNDWYLDFVIGYEFNRYDGNFRQAGFGDFTDLTIVLHGLVIDLKVAF